jgi:hypothetical protein
MEECIKERDIVKVQGETRARAEATGADTINSLLKF